MALTTYGSLQELNQKMGDSYFDYPIALIDHLFFPLKLIPHISNNAFNSDYNYTDLMLVLKLQYK